MIPLDDLLRRLRGLDAPTVTAWVAAGWVRPARPDDPPAFDEVDVARVRLILELRDEMDVNEAAIPVVLDLLDQLHDARRRASTLAVALSRARRG